MPLGFWVCTRIEGHFKAGGGGDDAQEEAGAAAGRGGGGRGRGGGGRGSTRGGGGRGGRDRGGGGKKPGLPQADPPQPPNRLRDQAVQSGGRSSREAFYVREPKLIKINEACRASLERLLVLMLLACDSIWLSQRRRSAAHLVLVPVLAPGWRGTLHSCKPGETEAK